MNYKKVIEDFNNGTLNPSEITLVMDNDCGYWMYHPNDKSITDKECDEKVKSLNATYGEPDGYCDIIDVLQAANVNCEWC